MNLRIRGAAAATLMTVAAATGWGGAVSASAYAQAQPTANPAATIAIKAHRVSSAPASIREELAVGRSVLPGTLGTCGNPEWVHLWYNKSSAINCVGFRGWTLVGDNNTEYLCAGNNNGLVEFFREGDNNPSDALYAQFDHGHAYNFSSYGTYVYVGEVYIQNWTGGDTCSTIVPLRADK